MEKRRWSQGVWERIVWGLKWGAGLTLLYIPVVLFKERVINNNPLRLDTTLVLAVLVLIGVGIGVGVVVGILRPLFIYGVWGAAIIGAVILDTLVILVFRDLDLWHLGMAGPVFTLGFFALLGGLAGAALYRIWEI